MIKIRVTQVQKTRIPMRTPLPGKLKPTTKSSSPDLFKFTLSSNNYMVFEQITYIYKMSHLHYISLGGKIFSPLKKILVNGLRLNKMSSFKYLQFSTYALDLERIPLSINSACRCSPSHVPALK